MSGYRGALIAAGATVHDIQFFGDYQGQWVAKVTLPDGRTGWVNGSFGSCSGCDAFEAEFSWESHAHDEHKVSVWADEVVEKFDESCERCHKLKKRLAEFGEEYFDTLESGDELVKRIREKEGYIWHEDEAMANYVEKKERE